MRLIPDEMELPQYGMNSYDSPRILAKNVSQELLNIIPGRSGKPRNGIKDVMLDTSPLGYDSNHTLFRPHVLHYEIDNKEFFFLWSQNRNDKTEYCVEIWNLTDNTRTVLESIKFNFEDVYFNMIKLYNGVYCVMEYETSINRSNAYRTRNKIFEYINGSWTVREMGIDVSPVINSYYVVESSADAVFTGRMDHQTVSFNGRMWTVGGKNASTYFADVYSSTNGISWIQSTVNAIEYVVDGTGEILIDESGERVAVPATFIPRSGFQMLVFDSKMWIIGGETTGGALLNDIWYTEDGSTWVLHDTGDFSARRYFSAVVYNNRVYVIGGYDGAANDEVWYSSDLKTWTQVTVSTAFTARFGHTSVVYNNRIWILLGDGVTNTYYSTDGGVNWTQAAANAGLGARMYHSSIVFLNYMYIIAGDIAGTKYNSVYRSTDGITWTTVTATAAFTARSNAGIVEYLSRLWITCGYTGTTYLSDAWSSEDTITWAIETGGLNGLKYYDYAFTFVRRDDENSILDSIDNFRMMEWVTRFGVTIAGTDELIQAGTVSLSGSNLTGSGTDFTTLQVGNHIRINGTFKYYTITGITNATTATVTNADSDSYTNQVFALLPLAGDSITTTEFHDGIIEGVEDDANRIGIYNFATNNSANIFIEIPFVAFQNAVAKGATHLRASRTLGADDLATAKGLVHRFNSDIAIKLNSNFANGLYPYKTYRDNVTDATLSVQTNQLTVTGLDVAPMGRYCIWADGCLWIGGTQNKGYWYKSQFPSGRNPQKFASLFNLDEDYITCDPEDGQKDTGCFMFNGDLYFLKEKKVFRLPNANIENDIEPISTTIGCVCPQSVVVCEDHVSGESSVRWISEDGPAIMTAGGKVQLMSSFRISELWPDKEGLLRKSGGDVTDWHTRNKAVSIYGHNSNIISFGDSSDSDSDNIVNKVFAFHSSNDGSSYGPFQITVANHATNGVVYEPIVFVAAKNKIYAFSHKRYGNTFTYRLSEFLEYTSKADVLLGDAGTLNIVSKWHPRFFSVKGDSVSFAKLLKWYLQIEYYDSERLTIGLYSDKNKIGSSKNFSLRRQSGLETNLESRRFVCGSPFEGLTGYDFNISFEKVIPITGDVEFFGCNMAVEDDFREPEYIDISSEIINEESFIDDANTVPEEQVYD